MTARSQDNRPNHIEGRHRALALIARQKTMTLATSESNRPWAAPVYYVFMAPTFYFFSSPSSKHVQQALANQQTAAALFSDGDRLEQLQGLQMAGRIVAVKKKIEHIKITASYLKKFPLARKLLTGKDESGLDLIAKVSLYAYHPVKIYYMNHLTGFGSRVELDLN